MVKNRKELIKGLTCDELEFEKSKVDCSKNKVCDEQLTEEIEDLQYNKCN